ncbi:hypothetical protein [Variovorax boronicumulans]|uniref:hypothetical protein n=1 Tax=Variovorax boronicumulans TaxID=436515 RepID=UPI00277E1CAF|nr:hypothetical protein [Variovorax boronicumulans]MDQ0042804.1 hypothetical protein [Variovorax boronicumulans]
MILRMISALKYSAYRPGVAEIGVVDSFGQVSRCSEREAIGWIRSGIHIVIVVNGRLVEVAIAPADAYFEEHLCTVLDGASCRLLAALPPLPRTLH